MPAKDLIEEMNVYYARRAPLHDYYMSYTTPEAMEKLLAPLISVVEPHIRNKNVLEIACGTGNWTRVLANRARSVTATDVSIETIRLARKKTSDVENIVYEVIDGYSIDELPGEFEVAFAADFWSHIPKSMIAPFLEKLHRKIKKDGRVVFLDMLHRKIFDEDEFYYDDEGNRVSLRFLSDGSRFRVIKNFPTEAEMKVILADKAVNVEYREHLELKRWLVSYRVR